MEKVGDQVLPVERKKLSQWFFNIKKFSQNLLDELEKLKNWPEKVKLMQKNWIGKSFGCEINFQIKKIINFNKIKSFYNKTRYYIWSFIYCCFY